MSSPYRSFTLRLAVFLLGFGVLLSMTAFWLISKQIVSETSEVTRSAVERHFSGLSQLKSLFADDVHAGGDDSEGHQHDEAGNNAYYEGTGNDEGGGGASTSREQYEDLEKTIRTHFDLYQIVDVHIYDKSGQVLFSYDYDLMNSYLPAEQRAEFGDVVNHGRLLTEKSGSRLHLWIPIGNGEGQTVGAVDAYRDISVQQGQIFKITMTLVLLTLAGMVVLFFALRQLYVSSSRTIDRQNRELNDLLLQIRRTYDQSLQALSGALDSRDNETQGHSQRVTAYSWLLGKQLGLRDDELETLVRGALLHDVGKIGIPDAILLKQGPLNDEEWRIMKSHVQQGVQMLEHIDFLSPALDVVRNHHERWDGKGYPEGKAGVQIPLMATIFSVCDSYDAMTSDRPYRLARSHEEALRELVGNKGAQFSPEVVEAFLDIPKDLLDAVRKQAQNRSYDLPIKETWRLSRTS